MLAVEGIWMRAMLLSISLVPLVLLALMGQAVYSIPPKHGGETHFWKPEAFGYLQPAVLNVRDHGAKGDGRSDDLVALQRVIDQASKTGGTVFFPPGVYLKSGELRIVGDHVALVGAKGACLRNTRQANGIRVEGRHNLIEGLEIAGARTHLFDRYNNFGIYLVGNARVGADHNRIRDCQVYGFQTFQILLGEWGQANYNIVEGCLVGQAGGQHSVPTNDEDIIGPIGVGLGSAIAIKGLRRDTPCRGNRILNNTIMGSVYAGIELEPANEGTRVAGNLILNSRSGGILHNGYTLTKGWSAKRIEEIGGVEISDNLVSVDYNYPFKGGDRAGVVLCNGRGIIVARNTFTGLSKGVYFYTLDNATYAFRDAVGISVLGNTFNRCDYGVLLSGMAGTAVEGVSISSNVFNACTVGVGTGTNPCRQIVVAQNVFSVGGLTRSSGFKLTAGYAKQVLLVGNLFQGFNPEMPGLQELDIAAGASDYGSWNNIGLSARAQTNRPLRSAGGGNNLAP